MGLISDYVDWVRGSYVEYDQAIQEQDLGVGADYEAVMGEPFGLHVVVAGGIGFATGTLWAGPLVHLTYHQFEKLFQGTADYGSIETIMIDGGVVGPVLREWTGPDTGVSGRSARATPKSSQRGHISGGRCLQRNNRGSRCTRSMWHTGAHRF